MFLTISGNVCITFTTLLHISLVKMASSYITKHHMLFLKQIYFVKGMITTWIEPFSYVLPQEMQKNDFSWQFLCNFT